MKHIFNSWEWTNQASLEQVARECHEGKLYKARNGVIRTYAEWEWEAIKFYEMAELPMLTNWWQHWVSRLGIKEVQS